MFSVTLWFTTFYRQPLYKYFQIRQCQFALQTPIKINSCDRFGGDRFSFTSETQHTTTSYKPNTRISFPSIGKTTTGDNMIPPNIASFGACTAKVNTPADYNTHLPPKLLQSADYNKQLPPKLQSAVIVWPVSAVYAVTTATIFIRHYKSRLIC